MIELKPRWPDAAEISKPNWRPPLDAQLFWPRPIVVYFTNLHGVPFGRLTASRRGARPLLDDWPASNAHAYGSR